MKRKLLFAFLLLLAVSAVTAAVALAGVSAAGETPYLFIANQSMSLDDNIYIYFRAYYDGIDTGSDEYGMIIWKNVREDGIYTYENAAKDGTSIIMKGTDEWLKDSVSGKDVGSFSYKIAAKEMADVVFAQAYAKKGGRYYYSTISAYSATTYAARMLGLVDGFTATTDAKLTKLLYDMMDYGTSAQEFFGYHTDHPANEEIYHRTTYMVLFRDHDGTPLKTVLEVPKGGAATPPPEPVREGYVFAGWSRAYDNITGHTAVTATYRQEHTHSYSAWQSLNETSHQRTCSCGSTETAAHTFDAKDQCTVCGYVKSYTVTFRDHDGTVLKTQTVKSGGSAAAPADPVREGYTFTGWDKAFDKITGNTVVTAVYEAASSDPTLTVGAVTAAKGETVKVSIALKNNPGILGMTLKIGYDSSNLTLKDSENGTALPDLTMQKPGRYKNGCNFVWYGTDVNTVTDGTLLTLTFAVSDNAASGTYPVTVTYSDGDIQDADKKAVSVTVINGAVTVP